jgi:two-component system, NarL family, sensor kinase
MSDVAVKAVDLRRLWLPFSLRWRVVLTLSTVVVSAFVVGAAFIYSEAVESRHAMAHRAVAAAVATATAVDREVAAAGYLLKGLSRSPALKAGDYRAFYDQLVETPRPQGSWFVLWSLDRQILNTLLPYETSLPTFAEASVEANINRIRERGLAISDRTMGPVAKQPTIAVHLRLDGADGEMIGFISTVLPEVRLNAVVREAQQPPGWTTAVLDRQLTPIAWSGSGADASVRDLPPGLRNRVLRSPEHGHFMAQAGGQDMLVAAHRSAATDYTTLTMVPGALANAPLNAALWNIGSAGVVLLLAGALAGLVLVRQVRPVEISAALTARRLRVAEARYRSLWFDTPESLFVVTVNEDGRFVFEGLNPAHERATGLTFEAVAGKEPEACLSPEAATAVLERYRHCVATGRPEIYDEVLDLPSGRRHWQTSLSPVRDPDTGRIVLLVGTARDVTHDREARARIEKSQRLLQATLDALSAHIAILDETGTIVAVNRAWTHFAEEGGCLAPEHGIGRNYLQVCKEAAASDRQLARVLRGLTSVLDGDSEVFKTAYRCDSRSFQMSIARFCDAGAVHVVVAHEDVSDLRSAQQDVRDIADRLLSLQEEERRRIAADLHDSTAQHIVAAGLGLMNVSEVARAAPGAEQAIGMVRASLDEAHKEIRTLSYLLYPPDLSRHGLAASLRRFVEGFTRRTGLQGRATVTPAVNRLPIEVQRTVLRVVQEALVNVHRHARATKIDVKVQLAATSLRLRVSDNGRGLEATAAAPDRAPALGVGIPGMQARISQFGGVLDINSNGRGTTVRASIPLPEPES